MGLKEFIFKKELKAIEKLRAELGHEAASVRDLERYTGRLEKAIRKMQADLNNQSSRITKLERKPKRKGAKR